MEEGTRADVRNKRRGLMKNLWNKINSWIRKDGWLHIGVSTVLVMIFSGILIAVKEWNMALPVAGFLAFFIGLGKEVYDSIKKGESIEWHDLICDLIGITIGLGVSSLFFLL